MEKERQDGIRYISMERREAWSVVDIGPRILWSTELKVGVSHPCRRSKFRDEKPITDCGPLSVPIYMGRPASHRRPTARFRGRYGVHTNTWLHRFTTISQGYRGAGWLAVLRKPRTCPTRRRGFPYNDEGVLQSPIRISGGGPHIVSTPARPSPPSRATVVLFLATRQTAKICSFDPAYCRGELAKAAAASDSLLKPSLQSETCAETNAETRGLCQSRHHDIFVWHPPPP